MTDKTRESAPLLIKHILIFLEEQLEVAEEREMTVGRFVTATWVFLDESCEGRAEDQKGLQDLEILESILGKEVSERGILRRKHHL